MKQAQNDKRLSLLPAVGTELKVHLQDDKKEYPFARINCEDGTMIIDVIKKARRAQGFPTITKNVALEFTEIVDMRFRDTDGQKVFFTGDSNYWLKGFPKNGESSVLVLCSKEDETKEDRTIDISCGWVSYTHDKVIVNEIVEIHEGRRIVQIHERHISEVAMVMVSDDQETVVCVRTTA